MARVSRRSPPEVIRELQRNLASAGFDPGRIDGRMGDLTEAAVEAFQRANGLTVDGKAGPRTLGKLASGTAEGPTRLPRARPEFQAVRPAGPPGALPAGREVQGPMQEMSLAEFQRAEAEQSGVNFNQPLSRPPTGPASMSVAATGDTARQPDRQIASDDDLYDMLRGYFEPEVSGGMSAEDMRQWGENQAAERPAPPNALGNAMRQVMHPLGMGPPPVSLSDEAKREQTRGEAFSALHAPGELPSREVMGRAGSTSSSYDPPAAERRDRTIRGYFDSLPGTPVTPNIRDRTSIEGMTPQALEILESARAGADAIGLDRIEIVAAKGSGHKSHQSGTEWDLVGYQADGTKWTNEQRAAVAQAAKRSGADRFGLYGMNFGLGKGTLHLGYSGDKRPAAIWGAKGLTSGPLSRRFSDPTERAFAQGDIAMPPHLLDEARERRVQEAHRGLPAQTPDPAIASRTQLPTDPRLAFGPPNNLGPPPRQEPQEMTMAEFNREQAEQQGVNLNTPQSQPPVASPPLSLSQHMMRDSPTPGLGGGGWGAPPIASQPPYDPFSPGQTGAPPQTPLVNPNQPFPTPNQSTLPMPPEAFGSPPMAALLNPDRTKDDAVAPAGMAARVPRPRPPMEFAPPPTMLAPLPQPKPDLPDYMTARMPRARPDISAEDARRLMEARELLANPRNQIDVARASAVIAQMGGMGGGGMGNHGGGGMGGGMFGGGGNRGFGGGGWRYEGPGTGGYTNRGGGN